jgi:hypothetical protein
MRLLKTSDLTRLFFDAMGTCQKRMRKLYDAGLVRTIVTDLATENRYALAPLGHAFLVEALAGVEVPPFRAAPRVDSRNVAHLDLLNAFRIALARSAPAHGVTLVRFTPEWELRALEPSASLIPDGTALLAAEGATGAHAELALEVDVGTEPPATVVEKVRRYDAAAMTRTRVAGLLAPTVLLVANTARRARSLARALHAAAMPPVLFGAAPFVLETGGLARGLTDSTLLARLEVVPTAEHFSRGLLPILHRRAPR